MFLFSYREELQSESAANSMLRQSNTIIMSSAPIEPPHATSPVSQKALYELRTIEKILTSLSIYQSTTNVYFLQ